MKERKAETSMPRKNSSSTVTEDDASPVVRKRAKRNINYNINSTETVLTESVSALQFKYNQLLDQEVETPLNARLFGTIDKWWGTPYKIGGLTQSGIDCSGFVFVLFIDVFNIQLPRTAHEQRDVCDKISKTDLQQGDLVFFHTRRSAISHVGIYLGNNKFVHASTSNGVMISDLDEEYWLRRFVTAGRVNLKLIPN